MGILDDAIREHLELKRKHGVSEDEVLRQEEEALGPARRQVAQQHENGEPDAAEALAEDDVAALADEVAPPSADQDTVLFDMEDGDAEPTSVEPPPVEPPPDEDELEQDEELEPHQEFEPDDELQQEDELEEADELEDEDVEGDEELLSAEEESAAESGDPDVLEDTPDFLQETPEHDRLWFEQKPPRDFDFD